MTDAAPLLGEYLDGPTYTFLKTVGTGTSGKSRLWLNEVLGIKVVSKTIDTFGLIGGIAKSEPRFLASLRHDHLVRIWEAQFDEGDDPSLKVVTFTTTYHEGRSVATALEEGHQVLGRGRDPDQRRRPRRAGLHARRPPAAAPRRKARERDARR